MKWELKLKWKWRDGKILRIYFFNKRVNMFIVFKFIYILLRLVIIFMLLIIKDMIIFCEFLYRICFVIY